MASAGTRHIAAGRMTRWIFFGTWAAILVLSVIVAVVLQSAYSVYSMGLRAHAGADFLTQLQTVELSLLMAESGQRGYILTGDEKYLQHYEESLAQLPLLLVALHTHSTATDQDREDLAKLDELIALKRAQLDKTLELMKRDPVDAQRMVRGGEGRTLMEQIRATIHRIYARKQTVLLLNGRELRAKLLRLGTALITLISIFITGVIGGSRYARHDLYLRSKAEDELAEAVASLEIRNDEIRTVGKFSDNLQVCFTREEAYRTIEAYVRSVLPESSGFLGMFSNSRNRLDVMGGWLNPAPLSSYDPSDCNSLRSGRVYSRARGSRGLRCKHSEDLLESNTICIPLTAQGETLGVLHLSLSDSEFFDCSKRAYGRSITERDDYSTVDTWKKRWSANCTARIGEGQNSAH